MLENIRSAYNVGAIFRTADGAGVEKIYLAGYTPRPTDRFGRTQTEIQKTSLGASEIVAWEACETSSDCIATLQRAGFTVVAVEQTATAEPIQSFTVPEKVVYVFGNEIDGVSDEMLELADAAVAIPMRGQKESLNVSVAAGIVMYHT